MRRKHFDAIFIAQYALREFSMVLSDAQWVTCHRYFHDNLIGSSASEMSKFARTCIGPLSHRVDYLWRHSENVSLVAHEPCATHCLLSLR